MAARRSSTQPCREKSPSLVPQPRKVNVIATQPSSLDTRSISSGNVPPLWRASSGPIGKPWHRISPGVAPGLPAGRERWRARHKPPESKLPFKAATLVAGCQTRPMIPTKTIDVLEQCWRSLSSLGAQLTEADWKTPTDLPGWSVQDNLSHLIGIERMMQGLAGTEHRAAATDYIRNPIGEMNENEVDARRASRGTEVLSEWNELIAIRSQSLRAGDDAYFAQPAMTPTGPGTLADFLEIRILDCWLHEQDMRRATGRAGNLAGAAAEHTVDRLVRTIPIVVGKRAATPEGGAVAIDILGGVERHLVCEVTNGRAALVVAASSPPLATIGLSTESFIVLASGRQTSDRVGATVAGDQELAQRVLSRFNMMI